MSILVVDVGTSGVRAAIVRPDATVEHSHHREVLPSSPSPGLVEFDAVVMADAALEVASAALAAGGPVDAVGIANQRASTIVWDRSTGQPVGPGIGWQDLRTAGTCLVLAAEGTKFAPNQSATKLAFLLDVVDPDRTRDDLCFGTVDTWIAWTLSRGSVHVTDQSNAGVTGLVHHDGSGWDDHVLELLRIPRSVLPTIVDSTGAVGEATALEGAPPIAGLAGDQQSSLIGQGCVRRGLAKATFGTGGMLDLCLDGERPAFDRRGPTGCFPIAAWQRDGEITWGVEAIMLTAGTNVEWLRDDLGVIATAAESHDVASQCTDTDGVVYVPALLGLGTPTLGLRRPLRLLRLDAGLDTSPSRAGRARGCRSSRGGPRRGRGVRHGSRTRPPAGGWGHDGQPDVPGRARERVAAPHRGFSRHRGDDARRRVSGGPGDRHVERPR